MASKYSDQCEKRYWPTLIVQKQSYLRAVCFKLSDIFGQRDGSDAFGRRTVQNIGRWTDIRQIFSEIGTTSSKPLSSVEVGWKKDL